MRKATFDRLVLAGFVVLAVLLYVSAADFSGIAQKTSAKYVRFLAISFGGLSLVQLALSLKRAADEEGLKLFERADRFFGLLGALILFAIAFEPLGFFIPAAVFIPAVAFLLGYRNRAAIALTTAGLLGFIYLIFIKLLAVNLPGPDF
ncbi:MAG: tripartite tricarboxylate transporter TctB family protein [Pikeienuella sp.]